MLFNLLRLSLLRRGADRFGNLFHGLGLCLDGTRLDLGRGCFDNIGFGGRNCLDGRLLRRGLLNGLRLFNFGWRGLLVLLLSGFRRRSASVHVFVVDRLDLVVGQRSEELDV